MKKFMRSGAVWLVLAALVFLPALCVRAEQVYGSIRVMLPEEAAGVEMTLYRVAGINGTEYFYEPGSEFADSGVSLSGLVTSEQAQQAADQLAAYAAANEIPGDTRAEELLPAPVDDKYRQIVWNSLAPGAYLLVQSAGMRQIEIRNMLVSVPSVVDDAIVYDVTVNAKYDIPKGAVILNKTEEDGNPLAGVTYLLQKKTYVLDDGELPAGAEIGNDDGGRFYWQTVETYVTDENGQIVVQPLGLGMYQFVEQSAPEGYIVSSAPLYFQIEEKGTAEVEGGRYVPASGTVPVVGAVNRRTRVQVNKVDEEGNGLAGATLVVCDSQGNIITDAEGNPRWQFVTTGQPHEIRGIPAGSYLLRELSAPEGYGLAADVPFVVTGDTDTAVTVTMVDELEGAAILNKTDDGGNPLAGVTYLLQRETESGQWETLGTYTTDANGQIAAEHLRLGNYRFVEQSAPEGYVMSTTPLTFSITGAGTVAVEGGRYVPGTGNVPEVSAVNPRTQVQINKVDENGNAVAGATLVICDSAGNIITDASGNPRWQFVTTGQPYVIRGIPAGSYLLREVTAPAGYRQAADVPFVVTGDTDTAVVVTMVDELEGAAILNKTDDEGNPLAGVTYLLQRETESGQWETLGTYTTDANGQIAVENLRVGNYRFVEQSAPEGYIMSADPLAFSITGPGTVAVSGGRYVPGTGNVPEVSAVNRRTRVQINKVDEDGNPVAGAALVICDSQGNVILDADGSPRWLFLTTGQPYEIRGIPAGSYILREVTAPEGYKLAADVPFTVTGDTDAAVVVTMVDEEEEPEEGTLTVVKYLRLLDGGTLVALDGTFYVALFSDAGLTNRVAGPVPMDFVNASSQSVTFTGLELGRTYYVSETDAMGTPIPGGSVGETVFTADYPGGNQAELTTDVPDGVVEFQNVFEEPPREYYYEGTLTITKRVLRGGEPENSNETFYAGIFEDPGYTTLFGDVIELKMDGSSELSIEVPVMIGENENDSKTYYVIETDASGKPIAGAQGFEYTVTVDKTSVTLSPSHDAETVVITNERPEPEEDEGTLSVTKYLRTVSGEDMKAVKDTFYVALFSDSGLTNRASGVKKLKFNGSAAETVTFKGLTLGTPYYVSETDADGNPISDGKSKDGAEFTAVFADGNEVQLTKSAPDGDIEFENVFPDVPTDYYIEAELTITKQVIRNGALAGTDETFYAGIFEDEGYTKRYGDVVELPMNGDSRYSVTVPVVAGEHVGDEKTYYVTETDKDGTPVAGSASFTYKVSVDKTSVTLSGENDTEEVVITNSRTETPGLPQQPANPSNPSSTPAPSVRTGDETPIAQYALTFAVSAAVLAGLVIFTRKRKKAR